ncbi:MAG: response regulator transcription factor [Anaerolineae bacterium]
MSEQRIRVLIVDDHAVVRSGLGAFLSAYADLELVGEAANGEQALERARSLHPDVILMDLMMPVMDGVQAIAALKREGSPARVLALTSFAEDELVQRALHAGALGYLLKNVSHEHLVQAVRDAYAGRGTLSPEATASLIRQAQAPPPLGQDLTPREREVLALLVRGMSNPQIASELYVSDATVKSHVSNILSKLGATSRTEAVALSLQHGLVAGPDSPN